MDFATAHPNAGWWLLTIVVICLFVFKNPEQILKIVKSIQGLSQTIIGSFKNDPKNTAFLIFIHFMWLASLYWLLKSIWFHLRFLTPFLRPEVLKPYFSENYLKRFDASFLTWLSILALFLISGLVYVFPRNFKGIKWVRGWFDNYRKNTPLFLLSSFGILFFSREIISTIFHIPNELKWDWQWWNASPTERNPTYLLIMIFSAIGIVPWIFQLIGNLAQWRTLKVYFFPAFVNALINTGYIFVIGIFELIYTPKLLNVDSFSSYYSKHSWIRPILVDSYLWPVLDLSLIWLFYHWVWFEKAKVEEDSLLPKWVQKEKFWWIFVGVTAGFGLISLILNIYFYMTVSENTTYMPLLPPKS